jgi:hypothetical protein
VQRIARVMQGYRASQRLELELSVEYLGNCVVRQEMNFSGQEEDTSEPIGKW